MKIFLSWSGERSKDVATALRDWLPLVLHYAVPWMSDKDIQAGDRWSVELENELRESRFGIICLTPENLTKPWVLFEAGALSKSFSQGAVCPYLYDLDHSAITEPLKQFQGKKSDRPSTKQLVESLNSKSEIPIDPNKLNTLYESLWPKLEDQILSIPSQNTESQQPRPMSEILEDLVQSVSAMEGKLREFSDKITQHDEAIRTITRFEDDILSLKFIIVASESESVGNLKAGGKMSLQGPVTRLIHAVASRLGLDPALYNSHWSLSDPTANKILSRYDILELSSKYRGQVCTLRIFNDIPF